MQIINLRDIPKKDSTSPGGKYGCEHSDSDKWLVRMGKDRHVAKLDPKGYFYDEE